jgi:hypothetical protein
VRRRSAPGPKWRTNEEILHREQLADQWNIHIDVHLNSFRNFSIRFMMMQMVRCRKNSVYPKEARQALPENVEWLNIVVGGVDVALSMIEIDIRCDERTLFIQELADLGELFSLTLPNILEHTLRHDDVKSPVSEFDRVFDEVSLEQVGSRVVYRYINPVVVYVLPKKAHQRRRPAADIEKVAVFISRDPIHHPRNLFESKVGFRVLQVLSAPKVVFLIFVGNL